MSCNQQQQNTKNIIVCVFNVSIILKNKLFIVLNEWLFVQFTILYIEPCMIFHDLCIPVLLLFCALSIKKYFSVVAL